MCNGVLRFSEAIVALINCISGNLPQCKKQKHNKRKTTRKPCKYLDNI